MPSKAFRCPWSRCQASSSAGRQSPSPQGFPPELRLGHSPRGTRTRPAKLSGFDGFPLPLRDDLIELFHPRFRLPMRPATAIEEGGDDAGVGQQFRAAHDSLLNMDRGCADLIDGADDLNVIA